jgi:hypothetical protein
MEEQTIAPPDPELRKSSVRRREVLSGWELSPRSRVAEHICILLHAHSTSILTPEITPLSTSQRDRENWVRVRRSSVGRLETKQSVVKMDEARTISHRSQMQSTYLGPSNLQSGKATTSALVEGEAVTQTDTSLVEVFIKSSRRETRADKNEHIR